MPKKFEKVFIVLVFLFSTGAISSLVLNERGFDGDSAAGDPLARVVWTAVYFSISLGILLLMKRLYVVATRDKLLLALVGFAVISATWSVDPALTIRRSIALLLTTLFGIYVAARYTLREQVRMLAWALSIVILLSLAAGILLPSVAIADGDWRGVFGTKNELGRMGALAVPVFLVLAMRARPILKVALYALTLLATAAVVLSGSATGLVVLFTLAIGTPALLWYRRKPVGRLLPLVAVALLLVMLGAVFQLEALDIVLQALGRNTTLTGRTAVWAQVIASISQRPFFGAGYDAFWASSGGNRIRGFVGEVFVHAHNGYLDLCLDLGLVGLALYLASLFSNFFESVRWRQGKTTLETLWPMLFYLFIIFYNFTESSVLTRNSIFWILYVSTSLRLREYLKQMNWSMPSSSFSAVDSSTSVSIPAVPVLGRVCE